jgi:hypothetical protein
VYARRVLSMRRVVANCVVLVLLGIFFAPAIAAAAPNPVPLCCRRGGAHHCLAMAAIMGTDGTCVRANNPCPMRQGPQLGSSVIGLPASLATSFELGDQARIRGVVPEGYFAPVSADRQRGPPTLRA